MEFDDFIKEKKTIDLQKANGEAIKYLVLFMLIFGIPFILSGVLHYQK